MLTLAWRNLWRRRWRSLLTTGAVGVVVLLTLVYFGFGGAAQNGVYQNLTETSGHLQVHVQDYRDLRAFGDLLIRDAASVRQELESKTENAQVVEVLEVPGLLEGDGRSRGVLLQGVAQPEAMRTQYAEANLAEGTLPEPGDVQGVALSQGLARALNAQLGDTVYMYAPGTEGYGASAYTVVGLLDLPGAVQLARVSLRAAQELAAPGAVSRFEVHLPFKRLTDDAALPGARARLSAQLGEGYSVETWAEVNPSMAAYLAALGPSTVVVTGLFFILAGLLVTNTVYLSVIERVREFGVIQALGAGRRKVIGMVLTESLVLCAVGALVGAALGLGIVAVLAQGFSFPAELADLYAESGLPTVLYASVSLGQLLTTVVFTFVTGVLAALLPAFAAARLEPTEAMRFSA